MGGFTKFWEITAYVVMCVAIILDSWYNNGYELEQAIRY